MAKSGMRFEELVLSGPVNVPRAVTRLGCGPLRLSFDPASGALRGITFGEREVLQNVYVAVRDANWGTVAPEIADVAIQTSDDGFHVTFTALCKAGDIAFRWHGEITGDDSGALRYTMQGNALSAFRASRIGFCVLHPLACAGAKCMVEHADGTVENTAFPAHVAAHQPFLQVRALTHEVCRGVKATVTFEGDIFETEDQRNWTDASFKTYCRPLGLPYPFEIQVGEEVRQSITLALSVANPRRKTSFLPASTAYAGAGGPVWLHIPPVAGARRAPALGLGMASHDQPITDRERDRLRAMNLSHLRTDVPLPADTSALPVAARLRAAADLAVALGPDVTVECALHLPGGVAEQHIRSNLTGLLSMLTTAQWRRIGRMLVFQEGEKVTPRRAVESVIDAVAPGTRRRPFPIVGGTDAYFAELNRGELPLDLLDGVCYSINPQVHAFDNLSLVENLATQGDTVQSARRMAGRKRIAISPVTLRPRFNPNATGPEPPTPAGELPPQVDPRQMSLFAAGWTLGSLAYLCASDPSSVTYFETTGWCGVMETDSGSPLPEKFPSLPGAVYPLYHVLADIGELRAGAVNAMSSSSPGAAVALCVRSRGRTSILCANLTPEPLRVVLPCPPRVPIAWSPPAERAAHRRARLRSLDAATAGFAMREPERYRAEAWETVSAPPDGLEHTLPPYAVVRVDFDEANNV